jgi:cellulose synthase (UDP-forming)
MQVNLALRKTMPDDQRFFFEAIMPSRDGWNAAFCCGSNSVTKRAALREAGDGLPTGSITEDMLLTLKMRRQGYVIPLFV